jgi:hypothetical protein
LQPALFTVKQAGVWGFRVVHGVGLVGGSNSINGSNAEIVLGSRIGRLN